MTDEQGFLRAILAAPEDDAVRLVYADWLDDQARGVACQRCKQGVNPIYTAGAGKLRWHAGDGAMGVVDCPDCHGTGRVSDGRAERAEFIRVQCRIARIDDEVQSDEDCDSLGCPSCMERRPLRRRERELREVHTPEWFALPGLDACSVWDHPPQIRWFIPGNPGASYVLGAETRCGFVEAVITDAASWLAHGPQIVACQPVREVRLSGLEPAQRKGQWSWWWCATRQHFAMLERHDHVPQEIFVHLPGANLRRNRAYFDQQADALAALSAATIAWARREAGLPPLPR